MLSEKEVGAVKAGLLARLADIEAAGRATSDSRKPVELDQQSVGRLSRMDAIQVQAMALATEERRAQERRRVLAAIRRIETGEYGYCVRCGDEVGEARLRLDPTATLCLPCAKARDRG